MSRWMTLWEWQYSMERSSCHRHFLHSSGSMPSGLRSRSSRIVRSTNSKTRCSLPLRRKTSIRLTMLSCLSCCDGVGRRGAGARRIEGAGNLMPEALPSAACAKTHLQDANFAKRGLADLLVLVRLLELLDCNDLPSLLVACLEDNAVRSARRKRRLSTASLVRGGRGSARTPPRSCPAPRSSPSSREALEDKDSSSSQALPHSPSPSVENSLKVGLKVLCKIREHSLKIRG